MRRLLYLGLLLGCLTAAPASAGRPGVCGVAPPVCEYGQIPVCWCLTGDDDVTCAWYCVSDGTSTGD